MALSSPIDINTDPVPQFLKLAETRKITFDDLSSYYHSVENRILDGMNPLNDIAKQLYYEKNSFILTKQRNNMLTQRIKDDLMDLVYMTKNGSKWVYFVITNIRVIKFNDVITYSVPAMVKYVITANICKPNPKGDYYLRDSASDYQFYSILKRSVTFTTMMHPAILGTESMTGSLYDIRENGGLITTTVKGNTQLARLKQSIQLSKDGIRMSVIDKGKNTESYSAIYKSTIFDIQSMVTVLFLNNPNHLMSWEMKDVMYFILKDVSIDGSGFNNTARKRPSIKFNSVIYKAYLKYIKDENKLGHKLNVSEFSVPIKYVNEYLTELGRYSIHLIETIEDIKQKTHNDVVYLSMGLFKHIMYPTEIKFNPLNFHEDVAGRGSIKIEIEMKKSLALLNANTPIGYMFKLMKKLNKDVDYVVISQMETLVDNMNRMVLGRMSGEDLGMLVNEDNDNWNDRSIETVDDKIYNRYKSEMLKILSDIRKQKKTNPDLKWFKTYFTSKLEGMHEKLSTINKINQTGGKTASGASEDTGFRVEALTTFYTSASYVTAVVVESNPDMKTAMDSRILHPTGYPFVAPDHTPSDKTNGGLTRHLTSTSYITYKPLESETITQISSILREYDDVVKDLNPDSGVFGETMIKINLNHTPLISVTKSMKDQYMDVILLAKRLQLVKKDLGVHDLGINAIDIMSIHGTIAYPVIHVRSYEEFCVDNGYDIMKIYSLDHVIWDEIYEYCFDKLRDTRLVKINGLHRKYDPDTETRLEFILRCGVFEYITIHDQNRRLWQKVIWTSISDYDMHKRDSGYNMVNDSGYSIICPGQLHSLVTIYNPMFNLNVGTRIIYAAGHTKHLFTESDGMPNISGENRYPVYTTPSVLRGIGKRGLGDKQAGMLSTVSSGCDYSICQEDHYLVSDKSMWKMGYKLIKKHLEKFDHIINSESDLPISSPLQYIPNQRFIYNQWIEDNEITSDRYDNVDDPDAWPIVMKKGQTIKDGDIMIVLFYPDEKHIGSASVKHHGGDGKFVSYKIVNTKGKTKQGRVEYMVEDVFTGHASQKLTTYQGQKGTVSNGPKHHKAYIVDDKHSYVLKADITMSQQNVISRETPGLIVEAHVTPILVFAGISLEVPPYTKVRDIRHDPTFGFDFVKKLNTIIPNGNSYIRTNHKEYPMMMQILLMAQDGAKKGSVRGLNGPINDITGDPKAGGKHGALSFGRMDPLTFEPTPKSKDLSRALYGGPDKVNIQNMPVCRKCGLVSYVARTTNPKKFNIVCEYCGITEVITKSRSKQFWSMDIRNSAIVTEKFLRIMGITTHYKYE